MSTKIQNKTQPDIICFLMAVNNINYSCKQIKNQNNNKKPKSEPDQISGSNNLPIWGTKEHIKLHLEESISKFRTWKILQGKQPSFLNKLNCKEKKMKEIEVEPID